jgi:hypothetical protein
MDAASPLLVTELIKDKLNRLRSAAPTDIGPRGGSLTALIHEMLNRLEQAAQIAKVAIRDAGSDRARAAGTRKLLRVSTQLDTLHILIADYGADVGRKDLPVGLLYLIDSLIDTMLREGADSVVHLDSVRMYSTLPLLPWAAGFLEDESILEWKAAPIVFNLPALDPTNILLSPILAHEVGHSAVRTWSLLGNVIGRGDAGAIGAKLKECLTDDPDANTVAWEKRLYDWLEELLCDALATVLAGPSFLFASAGFLPAPAHGRDTGTHPFPADRIRLTLSQLDSLGWTSFLDERAPVLTTWLKSLAEDAPEPRTSEEAFLRAVVESFKEPLLSVAQEHVGSQLREPEYSVVTEELEELLLMGIPLGRLDSGKPDTWHIILAAWLIALRRHGEEPAGLAKSLADTKYNRFLVKSLELTRVAELWDGI